MTYQVNFKPTISKYFLWLSFGCGMVDGLMISPKHWGITACKFCMLSFQMLAFCVVVTTVARIVMGVPSGTLVYTRRDVGIAFCHKWQKRKFRSC